MGRERRARGVIMLEVMLALAVTVVVGLVVLSAVSQSTGGLREARERQVAVDLARSAMAKMEAGIESAAALSGPVKEWSEEANLAELPENAGDSGWELVVETEPSSFDGLTYVSITARRVDGGRGAYTLRQLVRLAEKEEEGIGEKDDVTIEAERGLERGGSRRDGGRE